MDLSFYRGKKVFVTGHNGFKGTWLCVLLDMLDAEVLGYSLPQEKGSMFEILGMDDIGSINGDVTDTKALGTAMKSFDPDVVIHMAAQPIVLRSYEDPVGTYLTNVMGTVNLLESVRSCNSTASVINVTTDKVYMNTERPNGYVEDDILDGYDPYANSKSCSELVTASYRRSFLKDSGIAVSTCRAGNVIGGGDYAENRIVPDCVRAASANKPIKIRNPSSIRPYQHVLDPLCAYLTVAAGQMDEPNLSGAYNIGPDDEGCIDTRTLTELFCKHWKGAEWETAEDKNAPHESGILKLDCTKMKKTFGWSPRWNVEEAVKRSVQWYRAHLDGEDMRKFTEEQIRGYLS